jgi:methionyl-tRNA formyltransferase
MRRILLIGQGPTAESALASLLPRFHVVALVRSAADEVSAQSRRHGVEVLADASPEGVEAAVRQRAPDAVVVSSYDRILPPRLLECCPFVNVHYAPLPEYRGRATVNWAIINRRPTTAMTVHRLVAELDAGPILIQRAVGIGARDTVTDVYARLNALQEMHLGVAVERHLDGDQGTPQEEGEATYTCTRVPGDGEIDWSRPTADVDALVRALTDPFPGAFTYLDARRLVIWRAAPPEFPRRWAGRVPGRVVGRSAAEGWVDVLTGDGVLRLHTVQRDGERPQPAAAVITSVRATLGLHATELLDRLRALEDRLAQASEPQPRDRARDDHEAAGSAPRLHPLLQQQLPEQRDQRVAEAIERHHLRQLLETVPGLRGVRAAEREAPDFFDRRAHDPHGPSPQPSAASTDRSARIMPTQPTD